LFLNQTAEYALRAMASLATLAPGEAATARHLAEQTTIPMPYLHKILRRLVTEDLLKSRKGHGGGFSLKREPSKIRYADVLHAVDALPETGRCAFGWGQCDDVAPCPLHETWSEISTTLRAWADRHTLADAVLSSD
jgi:Rrf2 family protein